MEQFTTLFIFGPAPLCVSFQTTKFITIIIIHSFNISTLLRNKLLNGLLDGLL